MIFQKTSVYIENRCSFFRQGSLWMRPSDWTVWFPLLGSETLDCPADADLMAGAEHLQTDHKAFS